MKFVFLNVAMMHYLLHKYYPEKHESRHTNYLPLLSNSLNNFFGDGVWRLPLEPEE